MQSNRNWGQSYTFLHIEIRLRIVKSRFTRKKRRIGTGILLSGDTVQTKTIIMKRSILLPVALFLTLIAFAQRDPNRKAFSFGPVIGFGHAWMTPTAYSEYNPGMSAGGFVIYSPVEHWGIGMDVRYSIEGTKRNMPETGIVNYQYHYLRVPLRAIYFFGDYGDDFRPKITVGPSMGFLIGEKGAPYTSASTLDFGVTASGGFNYRIYKGAWLNMDAGCYHGLTDAVQHTENRELHRNIMLNVGLGLEI